jgi:hypothetical protein
MAGQALWNSEACVPQGSSAGAVHRCAFIGWHRSSLRVHRLRVHRFLLSGTLGTGGMRRANASLNYLMHNSLKKSNCQVNKLKTGCLSSSILPLQRSRADFTEYYAWLKTMMR